MWKITVLTLLILTPSILAQTSDASTLDAKVIFGYQGWFNTPNDGANVGWRHWSKDENTLNPSTVNVDVWPDISEYPDYILETSDLILPDGSQARVFSSHHPEVQDIHFKWLQQYNLDGVFLQRFLGELSDPRFFNMRNTVTTNIRSSAEKYGRAFAIMYDITGTDDGTFLDALKNDWNFLVNTLEVTQSPQYQKHDGKPVVTIWGAGFTHISASSGNSLAMINFFKSQGCYVMGGVPFHWRTLDGDSKPDFGEVYRNYDAISPWSVGRYGADDFDSNFQNVALPDKDATLGNNQYFAPVIYPGSSWANLNRPNIIPYNDHPRNGGKFFWQQAQSYLNNINREKTFLYFAMFDEVDEGTAFFKAAPTKATVPVDPTFITMDYDGYNDPSDRYLSLAGQASTLLKDPSQIVEDLDA